MLNCIKMDLYRMVKMKSFYVILLVIMASIAFTTYLENAVPEDKEYVLSEEELEGTTQPENINFGMSVYVAGEEDGTATVYDFFYANAQAKFTALFLAIFTVIFSTADMTGGYLKNIAGQVKKRWWLLVSKSCVVFIYSFLILFLFVAFQAVCNGIFLGNASWGDTKLLGMAFLSQLFLSFAFGMICMMAAIVIKNNLFSMTFSILLSMNFMVIFYSLIDKIIGKLGVKDFHLIEYTVTGHMAMLSKELIGKDVAEAVLVSVIFILASFLITGRVFEQRDIG